MCHKRCIFCAAKHPSLGVSLEITCLLLFSLHFVSWPKGFSTSDRWGFSPARQIPLKSPHPPLHVRMSTAMSRHLLCIWIDRSVCHVGMLRAVCLLGPWKLVAPCCGSRDYPWKEPGFPPVAPLLSNSLTLISLWRRLRRGPVLSHLHTIVQVWLISCPLVMFQFNDDLTIPSLLSHHNWIQYSHASCAEVSGLNRLKKLREQV